MDSSPEKQTVRVTILSQPYTLRSTGDPRELELLAGKVDELMNSIASMAPNADSTHVAVLACLHLADRVRDLEQGMEEFKTNAGRHTERVAGMLEQLIASAGEP